MRKESGSQKIRNITFEDLSALHMYQPLSDFRPFFNFFRFVRSFACEYEIQIGEKKILDNVFQSNCSSHAKRLTNLRKIEKRPKIRHRLVMHSGLHLKCRQCFSQKGVQLSYGRPLSGKIHSKFT